MLFLIAHTFGGDEMNQPNFYVCLQCMHQELDRCGMELSSGGLLSNFWDKKKTVFAVLDCYG